MIILGIDPGYAIVGYGAIEHSRGKSKLLTYGAITTQPGPDISLRLREIYQDLCHLYFGQQAVLPVLLFQQEWFQSLPPAPAPVLSRARRQ